MQTFLVDCDPTVTASILDNKRLFKQIVEAHQILRCLLVKETRWKNHPAVKMWKGYEPFLLFIYTQAMINEWLVRGYACPKSLETQAILANHITTNTAISPEWFSEEFFRAHKSNLLRKNSKYYENFFKGIPNDLPYIWPV